MVAQGLYFLVTAIWPLVSMRTFEAVTGPKTDKWLVKTVSSLIGVIGLALLLAAYRGLVSEEIALMAAGSAAVLGLIDVIYVSKGVIARVYLLDALAEAVIVAAWFIVWLRPPG